MRTVLIAAGTLVVGIVLGALSREPVIRRLKCQVRSLRLYLSPTNYALWKLSTHEKVLYYQMLESIEKERGMTDEKG